LKRPILIVTIGFIIGIFLGLYFKIGIAFIFALIFMKNIKKSVSILLIISTILSFSYISYCEKKYETKFADNQKISGQAIVISNAIEKKYYYTYTIKFDGTKMILHTKSKLNYGDLIEFNGTFELPSTQKNYGGFDYRNYLKTKKIYGIISSNKIKIKANNQLSKIEMFSNSVKNRIEENIQSIDKQDTGGLLIGVLLGDKDNISEDIQTDFKNSGLAHLLAISGLHVNYIVLILAFMLNKVGINKRIAGVVIIFFLVFYMYLTDFTESVVRAGMMGGIALIAQFLYRKNDTINSIVLTLLIILAENPYKLFSIGLQLSYMGTIGIIYFYPKIKGKVNDIIAVCISAQLFVTPIIFLHYNMFSTHFLLANILASPLVGIIIILGLIFVFVSLIFFKLSIIVYIPLKALLQILIFINNFISNLPFSTILIKTPYFFNFIFFYILIFSKDFLKMLDYELKLHISYKKLLIIIIIILLITTLFLDNFHNFTIYFVDVGQGDCTLIRTNTNKTILIDGGGSENYDVGENVLIPYLLDRRITKIDLIIISHFDTDHVGGILTVMEKLKVNTVVISKQGEYSDNYQKFKKIVKEKNIKVLVAEKGDTIKIEKDLFFDILWPDNTKIISENVLNNNSIVCKLHYKNLSILFTGDIEEIAEEQILQEYKDNLDILKSTVLKVAHHGSKTSSIQRFIEAVKPNIALIGVGAKNTFGHPNDEVIERLENSRM